MDPDACLIRFLEAVKDTDLAEMRYAYEDLRVWMFGGGGPPTVTIVEHTASHADVCIGTDVCLGRGA